MFGALSEKFRNLFTGLLGHKTLTEDNVAEAVREVRLALLDADVSYTVASSFVKRIKEKALGDATLKSVTPQQQFIKIVHEELVALMGNDEASLELKGKPAVILLCGLQGSGKTTHAVKLASFLKKKEWNKRSLIAACDLQRPAAVEQLKRLAEQGEIPVCAVEGEGNPLKVAKAALQRAQKEDFDVLIVDTAGRLHIDEELMGELEQMKELLQPQEIFFVANAAMGQDAVKTALEFDRRLGISGTILTMLDGTSRAGAALSILEVTRKPLKFEGIGEKLADLQLFNPKSMADRILGMGDVINLVKRAEEHIDEEEGKKLEKKLRKASFSYDDYLRQMGMMKKMGSLKSLLGMIPGMGNMNMGDFAVSEKEFGKMEAMILSMTPDERAEKVELLPSRRKRIAKGSGASLDDVNRMAKGFKQLKQLCKDLPNFSKKNFKEGKEKSLWR